MSKASTVVYTAVLDDFDVLLTPAISPPTVDYVCYTNTPAKVPDGWETRSIEKSHQSARRASRSVKIRPHEYFPEYEYSVYVDGNFHVVGEVSALVETQLDSYDLALPAHPKRNCVYEEADACIDLGLGDPATIHKQMNRYRAAGFPEQYGLSNTHIILRRHNQPTVRATMDRWWDEYERGSQRDQLSFEFSTWYHDLSYAHFSVDYFREGGYFFHYPHKPPGLAGEVWASLLRDERYGRDRSALSTHTRRGLYYALRALGILRAEGPTGLLDAVRERLIA